MTIARRPRSRAQVGLLVITIFGGLATAASAASPTIADFETATPAGFFVFNGGASTVTTTRQTVPDTDPLARAGQVGPNGLLSAQFTIGAFGGFGVAFPAVGSTGPQDWSGADGFGFWFHGAATGLVYTAEIFDNRSDPSSDTAERFDYSFTDDTAGWRYLRIPFSAFHRGTGFQPPGAPNDGLTLTQMWGCAFVLPGTGGVARTIAVDDVGALEHVIQDFEHGLPSGTDGNGVGIGFVTSQGASSTVAISTAATPPVPINPALGTPNTALQLDL